MQVEVEDNLNKVVPFKYNPMLQRMIVTGQINPEEYKKGWARYSEALRPFIDRTAKELAIIRAETGTDTEIYKALSGYTTSLVVVNYRNEMGSLEFVARQFKTEHNEKV